MQIAEMILPEQSTAWKLARQAGVDCAVGGLPFEDLKADGLPWDLAPLGRMKDRYEAPGFHLAVIEARPPLNSAKRGRPEDEGDSNEHAGYSTFGRLYAIGFIRGLQQAVFEAAD